MNLLKYLSLLTGLMYLCLNKLMSKYGKRFVLTFYIHCIKQGWKFAFLVLDLFAEIFSILFSNIFFVAAA